MGAHHRKDRASDVHWAEHRSLDLRAELLGRDLLEEPSVKITRVINENVDPAEPVDGGARGVLSVAAIRNVELDSEEFVVTSERGADSLRIAPGGDDSMACSQSSLRDVDAQTTARACNEPDPLVNDASRS